MSRPLTEFEEWRVEQACKLLNRRERDLDRQLTDTERKAELLEATHWTVKQINDAIMAIRLNGGSTELPRP
jgi:hypothetical protein